MSLGRRARLALVATATAGCGAAILLLPSGAPLRILGGLLLVLVLPGVALRLAFVSGSRLGGIERAALSLGLSTAVGAVAAVVLHALRVPIDTTSWTYALGGTVLVACVCGMLRRGSADPLPTWSSIRSALGGVRREAVLVASALLVLAVLLTSFSTRDDIEQSRFTQLWASEEEGSVPIVGVRKFEGRRQSYVLSFELDGRALPTVPGPTLDNGETWRRRLDVSGPSGTRLTVTLRRNSLSAPPYRRVAVTIR